MLNVIIEVVVVAMNGSVRLRRPCSMLVVWKVVYTQLFLLKQNENVLSWFVKQFDVTIRGEVLMVM